MLFNFFGLKLKKNIDSILKRNNRNRSFLSLSEMNDILIFFTYENWNDINFVASELESLGKNVILWTVHSSKNNSEESSVVQTSFGKVRIITKQETTSLKAYNQMVEEFGRLYYDTLIDLTTENNLVLMNILAANKSKFCIGIKDSEYKFYDFVLLKDESLNLLEAYKQLKIYLNNISV